MNKLIFLTTFYFFSSGAFSQQPFAPPGAVWHYDITFMSYGGFIKIEAKNDTVIQNIICRKLDLTLYKWFMIGPGQVGFMLVPLDPKFVYQNGDTVFWLTGNVWRELYNFSSVTGSVWTVTDSLAGGGCDSLSIVVVDSTGLENINGENLRYLTVHEDTGSAMGFFGIADVPRIYERLGSTNTLFPEYSPCDSMIWDAAFYHLHCYEDSTFPLFKSDTLDCEWWWVLSTDKNIQDENSVLVYPIPATEEILLNCRHEVKSIVVWNVTGEKYFERKINSWIRDYKIDVSDLTTGLFVISVETPAGQFTKRFIKQ